MDSKSIQAVLLILLPENLFQLMNIQIKSDAISIAWIAVITQCASDNKFTNINMILSRRRLIEDDRL